MRKRTRLSLLLLISSVGLESGCKAEECKQLALTSDVNGALASEDLEAAEATANELVSSLEGTESLVFENLRARAKQVAEASAKLRQDPDDAEARSTLEAALHRFDLASESGGELCS